MTWIKFKYKKSLYDMLPILFALLIAFLYFLTVIPNTGQYWRKYIFGAAILLVIDRILVTWYARTRLMPPIIAYKRGKRAGKRFSQSELEGFYYAFASHVPKTQKMAATAWAIAAVLLSLITYFWIQHSWIAFAGILFTGLIAASVSLAFSYFLLKAQTQPLIEEVTALLDQLPDASSQRLGFRLKIGVSITGFAVVVFMGFGVMIYSRFTTELDRFALKSGEEAARQTAQSIAGAPGKQWKDILERHANPLWALVVVDGDGKPVNGAASGRFSTKALSSAFSTPAVFTRETLVNTTFGSARIFPLPHGRYLALVANRDSLKGVVQNLSIVGALFLIATVLVFAGFIIWLSRDTGRTLSQTADFNARLASGDLTRIPAIWSDDELGGMADSLRATFQGLVKMTREIVTASSATDKEVGRTLDVVSSLHGQVASQSRSADRTRGSVKSMEEKMLQVSKAMSQVANSTQEVSSAILEMQASVEEIARNADVLIKSVENTVSSSNEITSSAEEVKTATDSLHTSSQEAVSFLTELDASLEETRRNAQSLSSAATRVTKDAESGFSSVAAVEQEILRTRAASEHSRDTLNELMSSIDQIGQIVDVIQDVTEQTNLLSLNASIIAAGAGEHGKSFAVVATQIRELSARTAANAKEIRTVITRLTESGGEMASAMDQTFEVVDASTELSKHAGEALGTILESASTQEDMSKRIAEATDELAHGGQSASRVMQEIFEMIEGIARATSEQATSTRYLNEEAERVREVAGQLRNATEEQAKGARVMSEAITRIMDDSSQTNKAVRDQTGEATSIYDAMKEVAEAAQSIERGFMDLNEAAEHLQESADTLRREIQVFRI
jgi:methyl-accepting chemotaxis protein